VRYRIHL